LRSTPFEGQGSYFEPPASSSLKENAPPTFISDLYSIKGGERERPKLQLLKENHRPFDRTEREGEGGGLDPSIPVSCGQGKSFQFLTPTFTFHRQKDSSLF
jgi:hypothetical protein